jgi:hypothetical protein
MKIKNIVLIIQQKYVNYKQTSVENFWGLGDILRGIADLHELCLSYNLNCYVDLSNHPISQYLTPHSSTIPPNIPTNIHQTAPFILDIQEFLNKNSDCETVYFFSNKCIHHPDLPYPDETKSFVRNIFQPTPELQYTILKKIEELPRPFSVLHFRAGDEDIVRQNSAHIHSIYPIISELYQKFSKKCLNPIVLSDSMIVRKKLADDFPTMITIHGLSDGHGHGDDMPQIAHLGYHTNPQAIKTSLVEFFIATNAQQIFGYTSYSGYFNVSGFVRMIGALYDVPICPMIPCPPSLPPSSNS